jgi:hypothetical protein
VIRLDIQVEHDLDALLLISGEFSDLEVTRMSCSSPVDMAGAFEDFIRPNAVEVVPATALPGFQFAFNRREELRKPGLRIKAGIHQNLALKRDLDPAFREAEREAGGKAKAVLFVNPTPVELHFCRLLEARPAWNHREVEL